MSASFLRRVGQRLPFSLLVSVLVGVGAGLSGTMFAAVRWFHAPSSSFADSLAVLNGRHDLSSFEGLTHNVRTLELAAYRRTRHTAQWSSYARDVSVECVSPAYFQLLLPSWPIGSAFASTGTGPVAVVGARFAELSSATAGSELPILIIGHRRFPVIGVAPPMFTGADTTTVDVWIPFESALELCTSHGAMSGGGAAVSVLGRIHPQHSMSQAEEEARSIGFTLQSLDAHRARQLEREFRLARWGLAGALLLLAIGCVNACGLCLIRVVRRRSEFAIRRQLGASSARLLGDQVLELLPITAFGCLAGLLSAHVSSILIFSSETSNGADLSIGGYIVSSVAFAAVTILCSGLVPALWAVRTETGRRMPFHPTPRSSIVPAGYLLLLVQAILAFLLLTGGLTVWMGITESRRQAGFDVRRVGVVTMNLDRYALVDTATLAQTFDAVQQSIARVPGVERTALSSSGLLGSLQDAGFAAVARRPGARSLSTSVPDAGPRKPVLAVPGVVGMALISSVSPGYFETTGSSVQEGRTFDSTDDDRAEPVMIVDQTLSNAVWQQEPVVGQCAYLGVSPLCTRVIGVVQKRRPLSISHDSFEAFIPLAQNRIHNRQYNPKTLLVRVADDSDAVRDRIATVLRNTPGLPPVSFRFIDELVRSQTGTLYFASRFFSIFTVSGLAMMASGVYALGVFVTAQRRRELGVRSALGASRGRLLWTLGRRTFWITVVAIFIGLAAALAIVRTVGSMAVGVQPLSFGIVTTAAMILSAAMLLGVTLPILRAVAVSPADCLRE